MPPFAPIRPSTHLGNSVGHKHKQSPVSTRQATDDVISANAYNERLPAWQASHIITWSADSSVATSPSFSLASRVTEREVRVELSSVHPLGWITIYGGVFFEISYSYFIIAIRLQKRYTLLLFLFYGINIPQLLT